MSSPKTCQEIGESLRKHQLVADAVLQSCVEGLEPNSPEDGERLLDRLMRGGALTKYQCYAVRAGKARGLVLRDYVIQDQIGKGGMGVVFKAVQRRMSRTVAIKVLPPEILKNEKAMTRFDREVRILASLDSPHVVRCFDAGEANGMQFMATEFVDGSNCHDLVKKSGPFSTEMAINVVLQACDGLGHAHEHGIVHRDVKPANLMIDRRGKVKVLDLGIAGLVSQFRSDSMTSVTSSGGVMGTVDFMPPEQATDPKGVDQRSDVYSLGCTFFYLLTGKPPFPRDTLIKTILAHRADELPSLLQFRMDVPQSLETVILRMLQKSPEFRYPTMRDVAIALRQFQVGSPQTPLPSPPLSSESLRTSQEMRLMVEPLASDLRSVQQPGRSSSSSSTQSAVTIADASSLSALSGVQNSMRSSGSSSRIGIHQVSDVPTGDRETLRARSDSVDSVPDFMVGSDRSHSGFAFPQVLFDARTLGAIALACVAVIAVVWSTGILQPSRPATTEGTANIERGKVTLTLSNPNAKVKITLNSRPISLEEISEKVELDPGEYLLTISGEEYETIRHPFTLSAGQPLNLRIGLTPRSTGQKQPFKFD